MIPIKRALISVSDKADVVDFAKFLANAGVEILSTGGTAKLLMQHGVSVIEVGDYTGFPEMMDGRVKTLHPKIHGGILARRDLATHREAMQQHHIPAIDLVVVNLYPFAAIIAKADVSFDEAIENIDIGGPAMVRSAAKNHAFVAVITNVADYADVKAEMTQNTGALTEATCLALAKKAFCHTAEYDSMIANYLTSLDHHLKPQTFPATLNLNFNLAETMRYGENPHQDAAFYVEKNLAPGTLASYQQLQGKALSYNNIADADAAWECCRSFDVIACVIVKHANPCGVAVATDTLSAYQRALQTDPTSAFGGIIAFNSKVDGATATAVAMQFVEVVIAPSFDTEAIAVFSKKPNVRVIQIQLAPLHKMLHKPLNKPLHEGANKTANKSANKFDMKRVGGGLLVQTTDDFDVAHLNVVTKRQPTPHEMNDLIFAFRVAKYVKSNAIVFCRDGMTLGVGAGQMSRVDSTRIATIKAKHAGLSLQGAVAASDAFFPFCDGLDVIAKAGATAVIQPGGSMRDDEVINAANGHGITMVMTGMRHFRH